MWAPQCNGGNNISLKAGWFLIIYADPTSLMNANIPLPSVVSVPGAILVSPVMNSEKRKKLLGMMIFPSLQRMM